MSEKKKNAPTVITLTLPIPEGGGITPERATATLLIQRGDLAHVHQFHYHGATQDLINAIHQAHDAMRQLEEHPPVIPDLLEKPPKQKSKRKSQPKLLMRLNQP